MMKKLTTACLITVFALALPALASAQTCAEIHNLGTNGCAPSDMADATVTVTGVIYVLPGTYNSGAMYWQCGDGGLTLFDSGLAGAFSEGDMISVTGVVGAFSAEIQLNNPDVTLMSSGNPVTATDIGTADLADGTDQLGDFMKVIGTLAKDDPACSGQCTYTVDDGTGPVVVFVDGTTGIDTAAMDVYLGDIVSIQGATKCFNGIGELLPRRDSDIRLVSVPVDGESWGMLKANFEN